MAPLERDLVGECLVHISGELVTAWARLLEDQNPLHGEDSGLIVPGPALLAFIFSFVGTLPGEFRTCPSVITRFRSIVRAPCDIRIAAYVAENSEPAENSFEIDVVLSLNGQEAVLSAFRRDSKI